jgi:hypothetical protein
LRLAEEQLIETSVKPTIKTQVAVPLRDRLAIVLLSNLFKLATVKEVSHTQAPNARSHRSSGL